MHFDGPLGMSEREALEANGVRLLSYLGGYAYFVTLAPGVEMPAWLQRRYPEEMNVILQHQFWDLAVEEDHFSVSLRFGGKPARLTVPYEAIEAFLDPAAEFGLKLNASAADTQAASPEQGQDEEPADAGQPAGPADATGRVVSLDAFRERSKP